ncbi:hypothetical protein BC628DRAFT_1456958 [Trametes gibbosa]|nr:hypothetical protein BC628DRAFT_1456958 [Trametes gibbosa]
MSVTLPDEGRSRLLAAIDDFCNLSPGNRCHSLAAFQAFTGYANWAFNVFPLLKPALSNVYDKVAGKSDRHAGIYVNAAILRDLRWLRSHVVNAPGIHLLTANIWTPTDLDCLALGDEFTLTDASGHGLGIYFPWRRLGLHCELPTDAPANTIFFFKALAVCAALHHVFSWQQAGHFVKRLAILCNNSNTVAIFNSLRATPAYNKILVSAVDVLIAAPLDMRVQHVAGEFNTVADTLSRGKFDLARQLVPEITLLPLLPPPDALGASSS